MCNTCDKAKTLPRDAALKLVGQAMAKKSLPCLDKLVGTLIGMPEPEVNREVEQAWESRRRSGK